MVLIAVLAFVAVFAIAAPLLVMGSGAAKAGQKEKVVAALDTALGVTASIPGADVSSFRKSESVSAIPLLNKALQQADIVPKVAALLKQANVGWTPGTLILMSLAGFAVSVYLVHLRSGSLIIGALAGLAVASGPFCYVLFRRMQRFGKFEKGLPEALDLIVGALRAGHSFSAAMGLVSRECADPVGYEFRAAFDEQNFGLDVRTSLDNLVSRVPLQDLKIAVTAIIIQRESGGNLAEVLEKTSYMIRQRFRLKKQISVHTAQGRLTGLILTVLPIALGFALYLINPDNMSLLWRREIGIKLLIAAGCSLVVGTLCIQKIVRIRI
ncbi:MAG TPA: type II secretion system F family protein [Terracidiphilus sp.]|nr:type II secretion system F family protein [Terracidiphilus sp.]